jgi:hypothetical protein
MTLNEITTLTHWESRICTFVGRQRYANANALERDPGEGPPHDNDRMDIRGAHCEFAASIMLNLYWRPSIGELKNRDVGGLVEVRSTVLGNGRLIVKPKDDDDAPFALILADMDTLRFRFGGWMFARDAKAWPLNSDHGDPAHYVEQAKLWPRSDLMFVLDGKR